MKKGQSTIEMTFAVIIILLLMYGLIMIFRWVGLSFAERRYKNEELLTKNTTIEHQLLDEAGFQPRRLHAVYSNVFKNDK